VKRWGWAVAGKKTTLENAQTLQSILVIKYSCLIQSGNIIFSIFCGSLGSKVARDAGV